ncbi:unnamed protein product [Choristocarpus tenellus]
MRFDLPATVIGASRCFVSSCVIPNAPKVLLHNSVSRKCQGSCGRFSNDAVAALFDGGRFVITLERATGSHIGRDWALWESGDFAAQVYPTLPPARTLADLLAAFAKSAKAAAFSCVGMYRRKGDELWKRAVDETGGKALMGGDNHCLVRSVPVQTSRQRSLKKRLAAAAGVDSEGRPIPGVRPADALLLMSGSHPVRHLPFARRVLPDTLDELRLVDQMKRNGLLPKQVSLWTVANPMLEGSVEEEEGKVGNHKRICAGIAYLQRKVDLGAEVIITQPPLAWRPFERWLRDVKDAGILCSGEGCLKGAKIIVGLPIITSPVGLNFWLDLCGVAKTNPLRVEASSAVGGEGDANSVDMSSKGEGSREYGDSWFKMTFARLRSLGDSGGVAGVHVMAPGGIPRRRALELANGGFFHVGRGSGVNSTSE